MKTVASSSVLGMGCEVGDFVMWLFKQAKRLHPLIGTWFQIDH
jgi:hypothetical protein